MTNTPKHPGIEWWWAATLIIGLAFAGTARAGLANDLRGYMSIGYSKLFIEDAPGGSLSADAGITHALVKNDLDLGVAVGFHLLGSRTVKRGSLLASVDYSAFEADLLLHWNPTMLGPVRRISAGPALVSARGDLSTSGGGAAFSDLAVEDVAPGVAFDVSVLPNSSGPVRVGIELSARHAWIEGESWTITSARLAFHY